MPISGGVTTTYRAKRSAAGSLSISGAGSGLKVDLGRAIAGALSFVGTLSWRMGHFLEGYLTPAGALTWVVRFKRSVGGSLSSFGAVNTAYKRVVRTVSGVLTFSGAALRLAGGGARRGLSKMGQWLNLR
jgi:hypothetical protein